MREAREVQKSHGGEVIKQVPGLGLGFWSGKMIWGHHAVSFLWIITVLDQCFSTVRAGRPSKGYRGTLFHDEQSVHGVFNEATRHFFISLFSCRYSFLRSVGRGGSVACM